MSIEKQQKHYKNVYVLKIHSIKHSIIKKYSLNTEKMYKIQLFYKLLTIKIMSSSSLG